MCIRDSSICVHGDNPSAVEFVKNIRAQLTARGVEIAPCLLYTSIPEAKAAMNKFKMEAASEDDVPSTY